MDHPLFCWGKGPGYYPSRKDNPAATRGCKPISVQVVQKMMRAQLDRLGLRNQKLPNLDRIRPITPHSLRHSAATIALENGATEQQVQAMLRHAELTTTSQYVHNKKRIENAAEHKIPDFTAPRESGTI